MRLLWNHKDGGSESRVWCYGIEFKSLFSVILLRFEDGSREAYHSHAFHCLNWVVKGELWEVRYFPDDCIGDGSHDYYKYFTSLVPFIIKREYLHKVSSKGRTWVLTFRGPWVKTWKEYLPKEDRFVTLTHGRKEVK